MAGRYLEALSKHSPWGLPLAARVKFTENEQLLNPGEGIWKVSTGAGPYKLTVSDPASGQVVFFGTVRENGSPPGSGCD